MKIPKWFTSSVDPEKISLFFKSVAVLLALFGLDHAIINDLSNQLTSLTVSILQIIATCTAIWGITRKVTTGRWHG